VTAVRILGIETSCDETAVAIVENERVLINLVASQVLHQQYGGVVPEYASREHMRILPNLLQTALDQTQCPIHEIDGIAVTRGPGLMGALLVGLSFAKGLAFALGKPLLGVNHIEGHIMANFLNENELRYPFLCLLVSGGHTQIIFVTDYRKYQMLGRSVDDAAGEAFDKAARILNLPYPGGPQIDRIAHSGRDDFYPFPRAKIRNNALDFSFSGLKTALLYLVRQKGPEWTSANLADLCASYQEAIVDVLKSNVQQAIRQTEADRLVLAGGVAANSRLRDVFQELSRDLNVSLFLPSLSYCTDNAAMIARTGLEMLRRQLLSPFSISATPNLLLTDQN